MSAAVQRLEFAPAQAPGMWRSLSLALLAHALLLTALTWGVNWRHDPTLEVVEAELWAQVPQAAAPALPPPQTAPEPEPPKPEPEPAPPVAVPDPQIALERARVQREEQRQLERERRAKVEREKLKKAAEDKLHRDELARRQRAEDKARAADQAKQDQANAKALEKQRQENLKRIAGLAGASGAATATGSATQSAGPSASYGARIAARIKPNIAFTDEVRGNPSTEVEVRTAPDGTIVGRGIIKGSGVTSWDEAVLKAIDKTERLPRDIDGRVQPSLVISFRPKD